MCEKKVCTKCREEKDIGEFSKSIRAKDGLQGKCKLCDAVGRKERYSLHKEEEGIRNKNYYLNNLDKAKEYSTNYFQINKVKLINQRRERRQNSLKEKLIHNYRGLISSSFKRALDGKIVKTSKSLEILGCSMDEFIIYIESHFTEGMNWGNYGACLESDCHVWNLDHSHPISLAETEDEIIKLNHYTNFKPMWAIENIRKSNSL